MMTDTVIRAYAVTADDGGRYQSTNFANWMHAFVQ